MKLYFILIIVFFFNNCSFDNKTGIWKNENENISTKDKKKLIDFVELNEIFQKDAFNKTINLEKNFKFNLSKPVTTFSWNDYYYKNTNNLDNFKYSKLNNEIYKSKKLSRWDNNNFQLFYDDNFIFSDKKGNIIFFSIKKKKIVNKFNFYKKNYKKNFKKKLNLLIENNTLYVSDNLGYLYCYDIRLSKILWAKNYKIPFRSNLKIKDNIIYTSNQNNDFLILNKKNGEILKRIPTEENMIQNSFVNNVASDDKDNLFFLNSYGSLYSIDSKFLQVKWFVNLSRSIDYNPLSLFSSNIIVVQNDKIVISTDRHTYIVDVNNGSILAKLNFSSVVIPIINNNNLFLINKNNFLIAYDLINRKLLYSYNIDEQIAESLKVKKKKVSLKDFMLVNNDFLILLNNSYLLYFEIKGKLIEIRKLNSKINSKPIFIDSSLMYLDNKNRLRILN